MIAMRWIGRVGLIGLVVAAVTADAPAGEARDFAALTPAPRVCADLLRSFERKVQDEYARVYAVFSGRVRTMTIDTAFVTVGRVWKGKLGDEVRMPTGYRDNGDGTMVVSSEHFVFNTGVEYLIFGHGTSPESLANSRCDLSGKLADSGRTIAVLDQIVKRASR